MSWTSTDSIGSAMIAKTRVYGFASKSWAREDIAKLSVGDVRVMFVKV
jgi:hypothetical protein